MDSPDSDEDLMQRIQADDIHAWNALVHRWTPRLFSFLLKRTCAPEAAEDALQDSWLRLWQSRRGYRTDHPFRPWLFTIVCNAGKDARRASPEAFSFNGPHRDQHELRDRLIQALHALELTDRRLVLLAAEGFESEEIARVVGITATAARMRISRARATMREAIGGLDD